MNEEELERLRDVAWAARRYLKAERVVERCRAIRTQHYLETNNPAGLFDDNDPEWREAREELVRCRIEIHRALAWLAKLDPPAE